MNIENIAAVSSQLEDAGFSNFAHTILKYAAFKKASFILEEKIEKGKHTYYFSIYLQRDVSSGIYSLSYYDAAIRVNSNLAGINLHEINLKNLESEVASIEWNIVFDLQERKIIFPNEKSTWETEARVERIIDSFEALEQSDDGKKYVLFLKEKYWDKLHQQSPFFSLNNKEKSELCQRFYYFKDQSMISVDEACRFLNNKLVEKQLRDKRKEEVVEHHNHLAISKKKRMSRPATGKASSEIKDQ